MNITHESCFLIATFFYNLLLLFCSNGRHCCWLAHSSHLLCLNSGSASFGAFEGQLHHLATRRLSQSELLLQMLLLFPLFGRCIATFLRGLTQDSLRARKRRMKERKWRHHAASIATVVGLGGRNRDIRVKHLVTQPGNAEKARLSHLTTADAVNKVSEGLSFEDRKGRVLRRMQPLHWDTATVSLLPPSNGALSWGPDGPAHTPPDQSAQGYLAPADGGHHSAPASHLLRWWDGGGLCWDLKWCRLTDWEREWFHQQLTDENHNNYKGRFFLNFTCIFLNPPDLCNNRIYLLFIY